MCLCSAGVNFLPHMTAHHLVSVSHSSFFLSHSVSYLFHCFPLSFYHSISFSVFPVCLSSPPPVHSSPVTPSFSSFSSLSVPTASPSVSPPPPVCSPVHSLIMCFNVDSCSCREQLSHRCVQVKLFRSALAGTNGPEHKLLHLFCLIFLLYFCK